MRDGEHGIFYGDDPRNPSAQSEVEGHFRRKPLISIRRWLFAFG